MPARLPRSRTHCPGSLPPCGAIPDRVSSVHWCLTPTPWSCRASGVDRGDRSCVPVQANPMCLYASSATYRFRWQPSVRSFTRCRPSPSVLKGPGTSSRKSGTSTGCTTRELCRHGPSEETRSFIGRTGLRRDDAAVRLQTHVDDTLSLVHLAYFRNLVTSPGLRLYGSLERILTNASDVSRQICGRESHEFIQGNTAAEEKHRWRGRRSNVVDDAPLSDDGHSPPTEIRTFSHRDSLGPPEPVEQGSACVPELFVCARFDTIHSPEEGYSPALRVRETARLLSSVAC